MNSAEELKVHRYLDKAVKGTATMSDDTIEQVVSHIRDSLKKQFSPQQKDFRIRMSNIGRPYCQLWFLKNKPDSRIHPPAKTIMNFMIGDIVEAVFKGILRESGVKYEDDNSDVSLEIEGNSIKGTYDLSINDSVDDIKSASMWSYTNKFVSFDTIKDSDPFGYVGQLAGYAKAAKKKVGGWWFINKNNAEFKYIPATTLNLDEEIGKIKKTFKRLEENKFERCYEAEDETFRGKPTGNKVLSKNCTFCEFRFSCWTSLVEKPQMASQAREPKIMSYVYEKGKEYNV